MIIIVDLSFKYFIERISQWVKEIRSQGQAIPILLVGFRSAFSKQQEISTETLNQITEKYSLYYMEISHIRFGAEFDCFKIINLLILGVTSEIEKKGIIFCPGKISLTDLEINTSVSKLKKGDISIIELERLKIKRKRIDLLLLHLEVLSQFTKKFFQLKVRRENKIR